MRIRKFKKEDARKVYYLIRKALVEVNSKDYSKSIIEYIISNNTPTELTRRSKLRDVYVAVQGEQIMGTANLNGNVLSTIFVNPKYHGKGIGTKLIEFLEKKLRKKGHTSAVIPSSITAYSFYKQLGYKKIKTKITKNFGKVLIMEKEL